ncbi:hypothetical protein GGI22_006431, partial [Coemansia erecta]
MSSVSSDDMLQDLRDSPPQEPAATQDPISTHGEENKSAAKKAVHEESPSPPFPNDVPMLRSCENCRRKKRKCSGDKPTCTRCAAQGEGCTYRPTARYFKPRANGMGHSSKKRASMDHVSSAGGGSMVTKTRFHHTANSSGFGGFDSARRPRAMSTVAATLGNMHGTHIPIMDGSQGAMRQQQQQRMSAGVTALAPADLMLSPVVAGAAAQADVLTSPPTPSLVQPGSAPCFRQFGDAPLPQQQQQQQQQQYLQMQQPKMAFGNVNGLAYMMPPVGGGDEDATASSSTYYTSPSTDSTPPQLLLNMDFSFAQPSSAAQQPLLSSMAMSMNSDATVTSPLLSSKHQHQHQQSMYPSVIGVASDIGAANRVVSSPQPMLADGDYVNMFANTMKSQQQSSAVMMMKTPMPSVAYTPASSGSLMYSSPASAMSSYPLYSPTQATTAAAAAAMAMAAAAANGSGMWPTMSAGTANGTGAM